VYPSASAMMSRCGALLFLLNWLGIATGMVVIVKGLAVSRQQKRISCRTCINSLSSNAWSKSTRVWAQTDCLCRMILCSPCRVRVVFCACASKLCAALLFRMLYIAVPHRAIACGFKDVTSEVVCHVCADDQSHLCLQVAFGLCGPSSG
jgi:hypothetical protein